MTNLPLFYEIPLLLFIAVASYSMYLFVKARQLAYNSLLKESYLWFMLATLFSGLWGLDHIFNDIFHDSFNENVNLFFHYVISHGFLLFSIICIAIGAKKVTSSYKFMAMTEKALKGECNSDSEDCTDKEVVRP